MVTHYAKPQFKIRIDPTGSDDDVTADTTLVELIRPLNAIDVATFVVADAERSYYNNTIAYGDDVAIYVNYLDDDGAITASHLKFYGFVEDLTPSTTPQGELLQVHCRHYARCLLDMVCNQEYGSESKNPTLDELHEILQDNTVGVIDEYVNDILDSGVSSGYSLNDTYIQEDTDAIKYIYFPFKPAKNCLDDLQLIYQALQTHSTAGWHWIVKTEETAGPVFTNYFCLTQVANHSAGPPDVASKWPTYWNTNQADSTLVEGTDFLSTRFTLQRPTANYVIYAGKLRKPGDGDRWTESLTDWDDNSSSCTITLDSDAADHKVGTYALSIDYGNDGGHARYPSGMAESWNIENWGGQYNLPSISFWVKSSSVYNVVNLSFLIRLFEDWGPPTKSFDWTMSDITVADTWYYYNLPMGPYAPTRPWFYVATGWQDTGGADWSNIDFLDFQVVDTSSTGCILHVDGLQFNGQIIRGAKKLKTGGAAEDYYKQVVVTDNVAKDDSGEAGDDGYLMGQMAYGELLRVSRRPLTATLQTHALPTIMAGQLAHIHGAPYTGGFRVDGDMRVLNHRISISSAGAHGYLTVTDDLINGMPQRPMGLLNTLLQATNPDFQNRQIASIKTRDVDITQAVLEKTYQFNDYY